MEYRVLFMIKTNNIGSGRLLTTELVSLLPILLEHASVKHKYLDELLKLLKPFKINKVYSDDNYAYKNHINESTVIAGKRNTQKNREKTFIRSYLV